MKIKSPFILIIIISICIVSLIILFVFQIIEIKDLFLNLISVVLVSVIIQYFFQMYIKIGEEKSIINRHYKEIKTFLDELFGEEPHSSNLDFILRYLDGNQRELSKYFGFHREMTTVNSVQNFYFLKEKYRIHYYKSYNTPTIYLNDKNNRDEANLTLYKVKAKAMYVQMLKDLKDYVKKEFGIELNT